MIELVDGGHKFGLNAALKLFFGTSEGQDSFPTL